MKELLLAIVSTGGISSVITWVVTRRNRDNSFLSDLQNSINILSDNYTRTLNELTDMKLSNANLDSEIGILANKYTKTLAELVEVKRINVELIGEVQHLRIQLDTLGDENKKLLRRICDLKNSMTKFTAEHTDK